MSAIQHQYVHDREGFFRVLSEARRMARTLVAEAPNWEPLERILQQLDAIEGWVANGRRPTKGERVSIQMGLLISRELGMVPRSDVAMFGGMVQELEFYFKHWCDDDAWRSLDDDDPLSYFPDRYAP